MDRAAWVAAIEEHTAFIAHLIHTAPNEAPEASQTLDLGECEFSELGLSAEATTIAQTIRRMVGDAAGPQLAAAVDQQVQLLLLVTHKKQQAAKEKRRVLKARIRVLEEEKIALEQELLSESRPPADQGLSMLLGAGPSFSYVGDPVRGLIAPGRTQGRRNAQPLGVGIAIVAAAAELNSPVAARADRTACRFRCKGFASF